jgi:hypothetical protein
MDRGVPLAVSSFGLALAIEESDPKMGTRVTPLVSSLPPALAKGKEPEPKFKVFDTAAFSSFPVSSFWLDLTAPEVEPKSKKAFLPSSSLLLLEDGSLS